jgi:hypothetical protein
MNNDFEMPYVEVGDMVIVSHLGAGKDGEPGVVVTVMDDQIQVGLVQPDSQVLYVPEDSICHADDPRSKRLSEGQPDFFVWRHKPSTEALYKLLGKIPEAAGTGGA